MRFLWFGKKKEKTLEERAKDFGIEIKNDFSGEGYSIFQLHGDAESKEKAENDLFENAKKSGAVYLSNLRHSIKEASFLRRNKLHVVDAKAYYSKSS